MSFRLTIGLGAVTVMPGSGVAAGACESWANAALPNAHSSSDVELEARNLRLDENDIVLILPKPNPN
jgi:copper homeostasis protein CutC